ncbi:hypothetical protein KA005_52840, partial [bacterium]|nr:hypothetical protein [bacterium]
MAKRRRLTANDASVAAENRGGRWLGEEFIRAKDKTLWECGKEHVWEASLEKVRKGQWCPYCSG